MAFIDLANVEIIDEVSEDAKMLIEQNGEIKRTGMTNSGDNINRYLVRITDYTDDTSYTVSSSSGLTQIRLENIPISLISENFYKCTLMAYSTDIYSSTSFSIDSEKIQIYKEGDTAIILITLDIASGNASGTLENLFILVEEIPIQITIV